MKIDILMMMRKWIKQFEDDLSAAAFAEAGELDTARELMKEDRRILLAMTDEKKDINAFKYAVNMCKRIGAALEILFPFDSGKKAMEHLLDELKSRGIDHKITLVKKCLKEEILNYTNQRRNILFVVVESSDGINLHCRGDRKKISESWKHLKCPLVVVTDLASA